MRFPRIAALVALVAATLAAIASATAGNRITPSVDYTWYGFFDGPLVEDAWRQREAVGFVRARSFEHPITHESTYVDGPRLFPGIRAFNTLYAPARLNVVARDLTHVTIDTIGGTRSPAAQKTGFLPYDLMGGLGHPPSGGVARLSATMRFIDRARANELKIPQRFGYHGWESETVLTLELDRAAARKVLGLSNGQFRRFERWFASHEEELEQAWWWWLNDEGGDVHVGGEGRLDVRYAFDTPLQTWRVDFVSAVRQPGNDSLVLVLDWVGMAGDILWSRWLQEALRSNFESSSLSDMTLEMTIGPIATDLALDTLVEYALTQTRARGIWAFEPSFADVPNLAAEYVDESSYESPGIDYADKGYSRARGYEYVPASWNLREGETLTLSFADVAPKGRMTLGLASSEPPLSQFPGQIESDSSGITFRGPMDLASWSRSWQPASWLRLADDEHPDGLLPWGEPYVSLRAVPEAASRALFKRPERPRPVGDVDPERVIPPFPTPSLTPTPPLLPGPGGRVVRYDFYDFLDVPMVADRWEQYEKNDYVRVNRLEFPVSYQTTPYFSGDDVEPFSETASGMRLRVSGRNLSEITIDTIGGGSRGAGFLPTNLMGGVEPDVVGGTALFEGHLRYGSREREAVYRLQEYWGYYGWENFLDARITLDRAAAKKVLGIADAEFASFGGWYARNEEALENRWRLWLYEEWKRLDPMPWFNFPIQIWALDLRRVSSDAGGIVLEITILNEALDVLFGRWFHETFLPHSEHSYEDMYLYMTIGPTSADVDLDTVCDFALSLVGRATWAWEPFFGDNPLLAHEYRARESPALPYFGKRFHVGQPDEAPYTSVPTLWNLRAGEQLNFHFGSSGLALVEMEPSDLDFPANIVGDEFRSVSITGPIDLSAWSKRRYADEWKATGGLVPVGAPKLRLRQAGPPR